MITYNRLDNRKVLMDDFSREYVLDSNISELRTKKANAVFKNYDEYKDYICQIDYLDTVYYNVTYLCNLHCPYCYAPRNTFFISQENNVAFLKKLVELNAKNIVLIGGEPMMHPKLDKIIDEIISYGFTSISIITNGTILKEKVLEKIVKYHIDIQISVDGYTEETNAPTRGKGSLNKVLKNIDILKQKNVNYSVMQVLTKETIKNSEEFSDFFSKKGIPHGFFLVKETDDTSRPSLKSIYKLYDFLYSRYGDVNKVFDCVKSSDQMQLSSTGFPITHCGAGITTLSIDPVGNVYPCVKLHNADFKITNLTKSTAVVDIKNNRNRVLENELVDSVDKCKNCSIKYICGGGCRAEEYYVSKNKQSYSQCDLQKGNLTYFLENINE